MSVLGAHGINYLRADTDQKFALGDFAMTKDGMFQYVQANGAIAVYDAVKVDDDGQAAALTTTISGAEPTAVGLAQVALADNEYGWVFRGMGGGSGKGIKANLAANCAADVKLYTTATAGVLDDTATDLIENVKAVAAVTSAAAAEVYAVGLMTTNCQD